MSKKYESRPFRFGCRNCFWVGNIKTEMVYKEYKFEEPSWVIVDQNERRVCPSCEKTEALPMTLLNSGLITINIMKELHKRYKEDKCDPT